MQNQYPAVKFWRQLSALARGYATSAVNAYYFSDAALAGDAALQAFIAAAQDPKGGNLGRVNSRGAVTTRADLAAFLGNVAALVMGHSTTHLQDFALPAGVSSLSPSALGNPTLPDPTKTYTTQDILNYGPGTVNVAKKYAFTLAFTAT